MATYKTKAIILSSYPYREHDRIVTFYTAEYGRLEARSRGTRKLESKLAGHLEPFIESELLLAHGRRWDILAGSRTLSDARGLRSWLAHRLAASVAAEAVKLITRPHAADSRIYARLGEFYSWLNAEEHPSAALDARLHAFLWELLALSGFAPELECCIACRTMLAEESAFSFSFEGGGMLCERCAGHDVFSVRVAPWELADMAHAQRLSAPARSVVTGFWRTVVDYAELRSFRVWEDSITL
ncbi:MAG: DNA repair protein RecO, partial [Parcubacteria group bacterium]|nr:DNA repair protein RecO [Parcubacteria group bacterium]